MIQTIASVATAIGVAIAALGIWQARRTTQLSFELTFNDRYRAIVDRLPIEALQRGEIEQNDEHLRALFDYLDLCEEQFYYRRTRRISTTTWDAWVFGMKRNLTVGTMADACAALIAQSPARFEKLAEALHPSERATDDARHMTWDPRESRGTLWLARLRRKGPPT